MHAITSWKKKTLLSSLILGEDVWCGGGYLHGVLGPLPHLLHPLLPLPANHSQGMDLQCLPGGDAFHTLFIQFKMKWSWKDLHPHFFLISLNDHPNSSFTGLQWPTPVSIPLSTIGWTQGQRMTINYSDEVTIRLSRFRAYFDQVLCCVPTYMKRAATVGRLVLHQSPDLKEPFKNVLADFVR